jgi:hypothetical protein
LETTLEWAKTITWKGLEPVVDVLVSIYKKGVWIGKKGFQYIADRLMRHLLLPKYYVTIQSQEGVTSEGGVFFTSYIRMFKFGVCEKIH